MRSGTERRGHGPGQRLLAIALTLALIGGLLAVFGGGGTPAGTSAQAAQDVPSGDVIVVLRREANPRQLARAANILPSQVFTNVLTGFSANLPAAAVEALLRNPNVLLVSPDTPVTIAAQTVPTGVDRIDADQHPGAAIDGVDQRVDADVAVIDTGIASHPDLNVVGGTDCSDSGTYADGHGHGTHVAGIIGALDNNLGVVGVAPGARLWSVRVLDSTGSGTTSDLICGLDWAVANAGVIDVVNMSIVGPGADGSCASTAFHQAICNTVDAGITVVAAAGNAGVSAAGTVPATYAEVIAVSAFTDFNGQPGGGGSPTCTWGVDDTFAGYSNYGGDVDIAAPGTCIRSTTLGGGTGTMNGTSMAAPHVTGAAALYRAQNPGASPASVRAWLLGAAQPQGSAFGFTGDPDGIAEPVLSLGSGQVASQTPTPTATATSTSTPSPTSTATATPTNTPSPTATNTPPPTATNTPTPAPTSTPTPTATSSPTPTNTPTPLPTSTPTPVPTNTPTPLPTSTPTPTPTVTINPAIALSSTRGTVNSTLRVTITGFPANVSVAVQWNGVTKQTVTTSATGEALASFKVPAAPMGTYPVRAVAGARSASSSYTIVPRIKVIPGEAATGATVNVSLRGYAARESVRIRWLNGSSWVTLTTVTTSSTGSANVNVLVPSWAAQGPQKVRGDGSFGRAQTNAFIVNGTLIAVASVETPAPEEPTPTPPAPEPTPMPTEAPAEPPAATEPPATPYPIVASAQTENAEPAWLVHDGDPATYWTTVTEAAPPRAWAEVDLGAVVPVGEIRWLLALPDPMESLAIRVSEDGEGWMTLTLPRDGEAGVWHQVTAGVSARFVRFTFVDTGQSALLGGLAEVQIWPASGPVSPPVVDPALPDPDQPPAAEPVAPASAGPYPVVASESSDGVAPAWAAHDGDPGSSWVVSSDPPVAEAWLTLDLGGVQTVGTIRWLFAASELHEGMQVLVSTDGGAWTWAGAAGISPAGAWQELWIGLDTRYIRLVFPNASGFTQLGGLAEVEIWP